MKKTAGIHHISAIVGHPQENVDFYAGVLGLRLIKKTINFDDPETYHLYFGDDAGSPGTIITFFPWAGGQPGRIGDGQVGVTSYAVPKGSLSFWENRLKKFNISYTKTPRFGDTYLQFNDTHGLRLELVERAQGKPNNWSFGDVSSDVAIKGFAGATLFSSNPEKTIQLLEEYMGFEKISTEGNFTRFQSYGDIGNIIDVKTTPGVRGLMGTGTVHHIAWRAKNDIDQSEWQEYLRDNGYGVTPVRDRNYFNAIYFREHGEILFEIATDPPGFSVDESYETLGQDLKLPKQYEQYRAYLNNSLIPIEIKSLDR
ncbi:ring-cleaving dioxygenase [Oceanobacillus halophilus]|uniref:Ring-cleaving dioxygenase n=1 Tax=Oceanobacillus halophilus TaxID=930130 RepID=A0A494ZSG0_9BACI|nr:ring-cleaving dioxygenase [Oceanobacillus halophilus]RKQ28799.1 ring-cleaving dioxygenase [Oceanobacillus halophilus]